LISTNVNIYSVRYIGRYLFITVQHFAIFDKLNW